jgi:competence protein ComEC
MWIIVRLEQRKSIHKESLYLFVFLVIVFHSSIFDPTTKVLFFDVKGDSILIKDSYNQCNILIDTGEPDEYHGVANYLSGQNVKKIDYLIVTHQHLDHYGEASYIEKEFRVTNSINNKNVNHYDEKQIECGNIKLYIYPNNKSYDNENNNSIVVSLMIENQHYLFTGDIESEREEELLKVINQSVDVLKVAHHGSNTSTSDTFLESVSPKRAFIIAHRYNRLDHPSKDIVTKLQLRNIDFFSTSEYGTIEECYMFGFYKIVFHKP